MNKNQQHVQDDSRGTRIASATDLKQATDANIQFFRHKPLKCILRLNETSRNLMDAIYCTSRKDTRQFIRGIYV